MFVANFIGSPPTNFLDVEAEITEDEVKLKHNLFTHTVHQPLAGKLREAGKTKIVLGIRPENFVVADDERT